MKLYDKPFSKAGSSEKDRVTVMILENEVCNDLSLYQIPCNSLFQLMDFRNGFVRLCYNPEYVSITAGIQIMCMFSYWCLQNQQMRDNYIKDVKGGRLKRLSAFLADRDWNAAGGVSCELFVYIQLIVVLLIIDYFC